MALAQRAGAGGKYRIPGHLGAAAGEISGCAAAAGRDVFENLAHVNETALMAIKP